MVTLGERMSSLRDRIISRSSHSPFLISYIILIIPLGLLGIGVLRWPNCGAYYSNLCSSWHVHLLAILFASGLQPTGSMLLSPASPRPALLSRLNPLICVAEGVSLVLTLFNLHFPLKDSPLSYPAAATLVLYCRESSSLTQSQVEDTISIRTPTYAQSRLTYNLPSLTPRSINASASLYVIGLLALIRLMVNKWNFLDATVITMLCVFFIWSFGFLYLIIVTATSRPLTADEHAVVEEKFRTYLMKHSLEQSLLPDASNARNEKKRKDLDAGWVRFGIFVGAYLVLCAGGVILRTWVVHRQRAWPSILLRWWLWEYVVAFPGMLTFCFALMKAGRLNGGKEAAVYWGVTGLSLAVYYALMFLP